MRRVPVVYVMVCLIAVVLTACTSDEQRRYDALSELYDGYGACYGSESFEYFAPENGDEWRAKNNAFYNELIVNLREYISLAESLNKSAGDAASDIDALLREKEDMNNIRFLRGAHNFTDIQHTLSQLKNFETKYPNTCHSLFVRTAIKHYETWLSSFDSNE